MDRTCRAAGVLESAGSHSASGREGVCIPPSMDFDMVCFSSVSSASSSAPSTSYLSSEEFGAAVSEFLGKLSG